MTILAIVLGVSACDPCAGTASCHGILDIRYGGQFIERRTGRVVPGVEVIFVRDSGAGMPDSLLTAVSDANGYFGFHAWTYSDGYVAGHLVVQPPPPWKPFVVTDFVLHPSSVRGAGVYGGRHVVDPYFMFIGEVIDRRTNQQVTGAQVTLTRVGGPFSSPDSITLTTAELGRFLFEPTVTGFGPLDFQVTLTVPGDPEVYRFPFRVRTDYLDYGPYPTLIKFPRVLQYTVETSRRGTGEFLPGVQVEFKRVSGIQVTPESISVTPTGGRVGLAMTPLEDGILVGDLTIRPPPPFRTEVLRLQLPTHYHDRLTLVGVFGYGPQVFFRAALTNRADGKPVSVYVSAGAKRVGGLPFVFPPGVNASADSGLRPIDKLGRMPYIAATADTGDVFFDLTIRFPGFPSEQIQNVRAIARNDSTANALGPFVVGPWFPWYGELRDLDTDLPIVGATAEFSRLTGGRVAPNTSTTVSQSDGRFRIGPTPLDTLTVGGAVTLRFPGGAYKDTVLSGLSLRYTLDDTLRTIGTFKLKRIAP